MAHIREEDVRRRLLSATAIGDDAKISISELPGGNTSRETYGVFVKGVCVTQYNAIHGDVSLDNFCKCKYELLGFLQSDCKVIKKLSSYHSIWETPTMGDEKILSQHYKSQLAGHYEITYHQGDKFNLYSTAELHIERKAKGSEVSFMIIGRNAVISFVKQALSQDENVSPRDWHRWEDLLPELMSVA